jgi:hypothetical protein
MRYAISRSFVGAIIAAVFFLLLAIPAPLLAQVAFNYQNITTDAATTLKASSGFLHTVCVNTPAATGTIAVYDNTAGSGTKIGTITSYASLPKCFTYDVVFWTGLTIVTATAAPGITVSFR